MVKDTVEVQHWVRRGGMLYNTDCLEYDDPLHPYNQIISQGLRPEDYGVYNPLHKEFDARCRQDLIDEILYLRKAVRGYEAAGF